MNREFCDLILEICRDNDIKCNILSDGWVIVLEKNNMKKFIVGYKFDNNNHAFGKVLDDKFATYELLKLCNVDVCEHNLIYSLDNKNGFVKEKCGYDYIKSLFDKYGDIVIKVNTGTCGVNVFRFKGFSELSEFYSKLRSKNSSFSICPFYNIVNEYRVIVVNNRIELMYKKELPRVYGDGRRTIKELLEEFNYEYFKNISDDSLDAVLDKDREYLYNWKFNLSGGARASFDIDPYDRLKIEKMIYDLFSKLDFGFCSIDIIKTIDNDFLVLEINSGVMMKNLIRENVDGECIAKDIYTKAIFEIFR